MSLLSDVISPQSGIISSIADLGGKLIDRLIPDPAKAAEAKLKLLELQQNGQLAELASETDLAKGQLAINAAEAASGNPFAENWRPAIGWTCAAAFFSNYVLAPFLTWGTNLYHGVNQPFPTLDMSTMLPVLLGLLGLGGMHMYQAIKTN